MERGTWWAVVHGSHKRVRHNLVTKQQNCAHVCTPSQPWKPVHGHPLLTRVCSDAKDEIRNNSLIIFRASELNSQVSNRFRMVSLSLGNEMTLPCFVWGKFRKKKIYLCETILQRCSQTLTCYVIRLDCKKIKPVSPKVNQPLIFIGRTDTEAEDPILWPPDVKSQLIGKDPDAGKD